MLEHYTDFMLGTFSIYMFVSDHLYMYIHKRIFVISQIDIKPCVRLGGQVRIISGISSNHSVIANKWK